MNAGDLYNETWNSCQSILILQLSPLWRKRMCSKDKMHPCHHEIKYYNPPYIFSYKYLRINVLAIIKQRTRCVVHVPYLMIFYITFKHLPKIPDENQLPCLIKENSCWTKTRLDQALQSKGETRCYCQTDRQ